MYLASFACENSHFVAAAFRWPRLDGSVLTREWTDALLGQKICDIALRVEAGTEGGNDLLLLSTGDEKETQLRGLAERLLKTQAPPDAAVASTAQEFDAFTGGLPPRQIGVDYRGYHHGGQPLACDFRLHAALASRDGAPPATYQLHLRVHVPNAEIERQVRKYVAWLDVEQPFSTPVRAMQRMLSQRLLQRGFLAGEYLATARDVDLEQWQERIRAHFDETTGRIGFPDAPIEVGDFNDLLVTGCHPMRFDEAAADVSVLGAAVFGEEETALLVSRAGGIGRQPRASHAGASASPMVFISYASSDYAHAAATCQSLEDSGIVCWIAPRDIDRGALPYTEAIQHGIADARAVVVLLSDAANLSVHIPRELDLALERRLAIIPVRLKTVAPAGQLNYLLRTCQWLETSGRDFSAAMAELTERLRPIVG